MLGRVLNTHQQWICRRLADAGLVVTRQVAVADNASSIRDAVREALGRADLVLTTGGLGPTADDLTRECLAALLGQPLVEDPSVRAHIASIFSARRRQPPDRVMVQALVPEGADVLPNAHGTAPGLSLEVPAGRFGPQAALLIMLPGPPRELRPMFDDQVMPLLRQRWASLAAFRCVTLRTCGVGESWVEERLAPLLAPLIANGLEIGYCARPGEVDVRLAGRGSDGESLVGEAEEVVCRELADHLYGKDDEPLESVVIRLATHHALSLAVAESCTGGLLAHRLTNVPGASRVFWGGWVTYDNFAKVHQLDVDEAILQKEGAVSEACAMAMAEGARRHSGATVAASITGIAGPDGGSPEKPVGTVYVAVSSATRGTVVRKFHHPFDRETFKNVTTQQALDLLRRQLIEQGSANPETPPA